MIDRKLYCEFEFWKAFSSSKNSEDIHYLEHWIRLYGIFAKSNLSFDCSYAQLKDVISTDEYLKHLWKKSTNGECAIDCVETFCHIDTLQDTNIFEKNYNATYFATNGNNLDQYGILNVTLNDILNCDTKTAYIQNNKIYKTSWKDYKHYIIHPCNSIIFIDNYILKNEKSINTDFSDIIEFLIPKESKVPIHITIITNELKLSLESVYNLAYENIKKKCPNITFYLAIYKSDKFHDRCIITNNSYITSGSGFDLFQGKGKSANKTTISNSYLFYDFSKNDIVKLIIEDVKKVCLSSIHIGDSNNRLL